MAARGTELFRRRLLLADSWGGRRLSTSSQELCSKLDGKSCGVAHPSKTAKGGAARQKPEKEFLQSGGKTLSSSSAKSLNKTARVAPGAGKPQGCISNTE
jgi:hypothetical protein